MKKLILVAALISVAACAPKKTMRAKRLGAPLQKTTQETQDKLAQRLQEVNGQPILVCQESDELTKNGSMIRFTIYKGVVEEKEVIGYMGEFRLLEAPNEQSGEKTIIYHQAMQSEFTPEAADFELTDSKFSLSVKPAEGKKSPFTIMHEESGFDAEIVLIEAQADPKAGEVQEALVINGEDLKCERVRPEVPVKEQSTEEKKEESKASEPVDNDSTAVAQAEDANSSWLPEWVADILN